MIQTGTDNGGESSPLLNCVVATDKTTGEQVLMECENVIVAADPETSRALLLTGERATLHDVHHHTHAMYRENLIRATHYALSNVCLHTCTCTNVRTYD